MVEFSERVKQKLEALEEKRARDKEVLEEFRQHLSTPATQRAGFSCRLENRALFLDYSNDQVAEIRTQDGHIYIEDRSKTPKDYAQTELGIAAALDHLTDLGVEAVEAERDRIAQRKRDADPHRRPEDV